MGIQQARLAVLFVVIALISLSPMGCGGGKSFSPEDFKKITKGMPQDKVKEILGNPADTMEAMGAKRSFWRVGDKYYSISFDESGKVIEPLGPTSKEENDAMRALMEAAKNIKLK
jgi:hypothetical protein